MPKLLGIIGFIVICAGIDLLWQSRRETRFWLATCAKAFRAILWRRDQAHVFPWPEAALKRQRAVGVLLGLGLAFVLGPILIAVGITLMILYPNL
jgi:hypothetical protein